MNDIDPIELELMRNLFEAAAEEMGIVLQRCSFSANIKERRDFSCALFDARGELLAQAAHIPVHLGSMPESVLAVVNKLGALEDGDVAIVNDPFAGGTHLPDITLVSPIFLDDKLIGYAANRAHHADVGGTSPGSMTLSRHIDEEGIRIEPELLHRRGGRNEALLERILRSVRTPDERLGDLEAQIVANHVGLQAMVKMAGAYGIEKVQKYGSALLDYSQAFMARTIDTLPDGEWTCADFMEDDGDGNPVKIHVKLTISGDRARLDFSDSADQVRGCINCPSAVTKSAVYYCFGCLMGNDAPLNGGCFRNIDILTREGSVVHAVYPSAVVAGNTETSQRIVDVVLGALSKAVPDRIPASSCGTMSSVALGGDGWTYYETIGGGCGAGPTWEGESAVQCHMTNTLNTPAEAIEMQYPLRVLRFERATSTGGEGEYRGGDGIVREIQVLHSCSGTVLGDRRIGRPRGLAGGDDGLNGQNNVIQNQTAVALRGMSTVELLPGDCLRIQTPGGGGFGKWAGK